MWLPLKLHQYYDAIADPESKNSNSNNNNNAANNNNSNNNNNGIVKGRKKEDKSVISNHKTLTVSSIHWYIAVSRIVRQLPQAFPIRE